jgi:hypothetical protein
MIAILQAQLHLSEADAARIIADLERQGRLVWVSDRRRSLERAALMSHEEG